MHQEISGEFTESETKVVFASGGHRHTISPFYAVCKETKKSLGSVTFEVGGHMWQIVCYPGGETQDVSDFVSLFLGYRGPDKECQANWRLTLVNQTDKEKNRSRAWLKGDKFNKFLTGRRWGWQKFIRREDLIDPQNGFVKDNTIIFEASLDVYKKQTVKNISEKKFQPQLYPVPPSQLESDFSDLLRSCNSPENNSLADVQFTFDTSVSKLLAHSQILAARSPVLAKMFSDRFAESRSFEKKSSRGVISVMILDVDPKIFEIVLRFIYSGKVDWHQIEMDVAKAGAKKRSPTSRSDFPVESAASPEPTKKRKTLLQTPSQGAEFPHGSSLITESPIETMDLSSNEMENESYELKYSKKQTKEQEHEMLLGVALQLYEAADRYELNRLRLIAEHKIFLVLTLQINRINSKVCKIERSRENSRLGYPRPNGSGALGMYSKLSRPSMSNPSAEAVSSLSANASGPSSHLTNGLGVTIPENEFKYEGKDDVDVGEWNHGLIDVLAMADRHSSSKLKKFCFSALSSDQLSRGTRAILLSDKEKITQLHPELIMEALQYLVIQRDLSTEQESFSERSNVNGAPEGGKEQDDIDAVSFQRISRGESFDPRRELAERGYRVSGGRRDLLSLLESARSSGQVKSGSSDVSE